MLTYIIDGLVDETQNSIETNNSNQIIQLRHPRSDEAFLALATAFEDKISLYEVVRFEEPYRSFFIDDEVQSGLFFI